MKLIALAVAALFGFWIVSALLDRGMKHPKPGPGRGQSTPRSDVSSDAVDAACRLLQLQRPFTQDELRAAYHARMAEYHPDKVGALGKELQEFAARKTQELNAAFDLLAPLAS